MCSSYIVAGVFRGATEGSVGDIQCAVVLHVDPWNTLLFTHFVSCACFLDFSPQSLTCYPDQGVIRGPEGWRASSIWGGQRGGELRVVAARFHGTGVMSKYELPSGTPVWWIRNCHETSKLPEFWPERNTAAAETRLRRMV